MTPRSELPSSSEREPVTSPEHSTNPENLQAFLDRFIPGLAVKDIETLMTPFIPETDWPPALVKEDGFYSQYFEPDRKVGNDYITGITIQQVPERDVFVVRSLQNTVSGRTGSGPLYGPDQVFARAIVSVEERLNGKGVGYIECTDESGKCSYLTFIGHLPPLEAAVIEIVKAIIAQRGLPTKDSTAMFISLPGQYIKDEKIDWLTVLLRHEANAQYHMVNSAIEPIRRIIQAGANFVSRKVNTDLYEQISTANPEDFPKFSQSKAAKFRFYPTIDQAFDGYEKGDDR